LTLTDRERFVYHATTLMTLQIMKKHPIKMTKRSMLDLIKLIKKNRCRKLSDDDIDKIYGDMEEEIMLSTVVYDMQKEKMFR